MRAQTRDEAPKGPGSHETDAQVDVRQPGLRLARSAALHQEGWTRNGAAYQATPLQRFSTCDPGERQLRLAGTSYRTTRNGAPLTGEPRSPASFNPGTCYRSQGCTRVPAKRSARTRNGAPQDPVQRSATRSCYLRGRPPRRSAYSISACTCTAKEMVAMAVSRRLRFEILRRDDHTCKYCGGKPPEVALTVDHVLPESLGGTDEAHNLVAACVECNQGKASVAPDSPLVEDVAAFDAAFADAVRRAANEELVRIEQRQAVRDWFDHVWLNWKADGRALPRDPSWPNSIESFLKAGLIVEEIEEMVDVSMRRTNISSDSKWKYFCGCCWRRVKERQERAMELMAADFDPDSITWETADER